mmetsp:Transcript_19020/g.44316  ORF Transcript_19020/g.44316 Transcript_19020/m.44316 type:complete len:85 (+) Transcript_19020:159-413(+)
MLLSEANHVIFMCNLVLFSVPKVGCLTMNIANAFSMYMSSSLVLCRWYMLVVYTDVERRTETCDAGTEGNGQRLFDQPVALIYS